MIDNWDDFLSQEMIKPYFYKLSEYLALARKHSDVSPESRYVFRIFESLPLDKIKVVILGQDPYPGKGTAVGYAFSVAEGTKIPPSLQNIFKEIERSLGIKCHNSGFLERWVKQGVFLLNATLTVQCGMPNSHKDIGWEYLINSAIKLINDYGNPKVFMLWGKSAQTKKQIITRKDHLILETTHPSNFSASRGFNGCNHFNKCNKFLEDNQLIPIDWR